MQHTAVEEPYMLRPIHVLGLRESVAGQLRNAERERAANDARRRANEASRPLTVTSRATELRDQPRDLILAHRYALPVVREIHRLTPHPVTTPRSSGSRPGRPLTRVASADHPPDPTPATPS
jgi:hypothetical protein